MSTATERARAKAERLAKDTRTKDEQPTQPAELRAQRIKPIRVTLDLAPSLYADFGGWTTATARQLGKPKIPSVDVLRILVRELLHDETLQVKVVAALQTSLT